MTNQSDNQLEIQEKTAETTTIGKVCGPKRGFENEVTESKSIKIQMDSIGMNFKFRKKNQIDILVQVLVFIHQF